MKTKKLKGFTLVEMIVVIAIIGVLATILIPTLIGYVDKAKYSNANSTAKTLYNAGMTACREVDNIGSIADGVYTDLAHSSGSGLSYNADFENAVYVYFDSLKNSVWAIQVREGCAISSCFLRTDADEYLGTYPHPNYEKQTPLDLVKFVQFAETGSW